MRIWKSILRASKFVCLLLPLSCGAEHSTVSQRTGPTNVVLIVIDTLRADHLSCNGYHRETSPNIDAFARKNIHFRNVSTTAPTTPPAMAAIMTGRYPFYENEVMNYPARQHGMDRFQPIKETVALSSSLDMLAEILQRNGYRTGGFITNPYVKKDFNFDQGFDTYEHLFRDGPKPHGKGEVVSARAIDWMDGLGRDRPFFAYLHYMDVHGPYLPLPKYAERFPSPKLEGKTDLEEVLKTAPHFSGRQQRK